jgi:dipeptidyl aminopeptidase/acylaminoacyl peptidase
LRLDTVNGRARLLTQDAPPHVHSWSLDRDMVPRAAISREGDKSRLHWKTGSNEPWKMVREYSLFTSDEAWTDLHSVGADDILYLEEPVSAGSDFRALKWLSLAKKDASPQTLISLDGYDFEGRLEFGPKGRVLGVHYQHDAEKTYWFDPTLKGIQQQVDKLLPGMSNVLDCGECANPTTILVTSGSDQQPPVYWIFDVKAGTLSLLARARPWIKPQTMAQRDVMRMTARDGLSIPVHVTRPLGVKGPAPMVVLVHGGPFVRGGYWEWQSQSQFLASRGYVVIEPEYRGSTGYGTKHFRAGWKQWGLAMQDDIADATLWAVKQGYADAKRVCIAGASYGGYATLMGLIRYPDLYKCGVNWVGVTDIDLMYSITWSDSSEIYKRYGMPALVGDRKNDAKQLADTSPLQQAAKLTQPLFMAYGGEDKRVPIDHGYKLRDAIGKNNPNLEWVAYLDEGHGWMLEANDIDFWTRVEGFLDKHLKNAPQ